MEKCIKYKRFQKTFTSDSIQEFFDKLVMEGWEIIYYNEEKLPDTLLPNTLSYINNFKITIVGCKKQDNVL